MASKDPLRLRSTDLDVDLSVRLSWHFLVVDVNENRQGVCSVVQFEWFRGLAVVRKYLEEKYVQVIKLSEAFGK